MKKNLLCMLAILLLGTMHVDAATGIIAPNADGQLICYVLTGNGQQLMVVSRTAAGFSDEEKYSGDIVIPESVTTNEGETLSVVGIASEAFRSCTALTSVTIPGSVTYIGMQAFFGCSALTSVTIPEGVTTMV